MGTGIGQHAALDHRLGQFLDEERHAVSALDDLLGDLLGQYLAASHPGDHLSPLSWCQAIET
jgi:hypothetical protein